MRYLKCDYLENGNFYRLQRPLCRRDKENRFYNQSNQSSNMLPKKMVNNGRKWRCLLEEPILGH